MLKGIYFKGDVNKLVLSRLSTFKSQVIMPESILMLVIMIKIAIIKLINIC